MVDLGRSEMLEKMPNPEVPVTLIYAGHLPTSGYVETNANLRATTNHETSPNFYRNSDDFKQVNGDGTVPSFSALIPVLKWGYEF